MDWWVFAATTLSLTAAILCGSLVAPSIQRDEYRWAAFNGFFCVANSIFVVMRIAG